MIFLLSLWVPNKQTLQRLRRFDSLVSAHVYLSSACRNTLKKENKKTNIYKKAERGLYITKALGILSKFDEDLKGIISDNGEFNEVMEFRTHYDSDEEDEDFRPNDHLIAPNIDNQNLDEDGWVEQKLE